MEGKAKTVIDNIGRQWAVYGDVVVRVADKSRNSINRLIASMERQAATFGQTGVEKLAAQRDLLLQRYKEEPRAIDAITKAYERMIKVEEEQVKADGQTVNSSERLIASLNKQSALYGKSG